MLVTLLVKFRNKDCKTTELGLLLQVLPVRIVTFVEILGSHLKSPKSYSHPHFKRPCVQRTPLLNGRGHQNQAISSRETCIKRTLQVFPEGFFL